MFGVTCKTCGFVAKCIKETEAKSTVCPVCDNMFGVKALPEPLDASYPVKNRKVGIWDRRDMDIIEVKCKSCGFVSFGSTLEKVNALECSLCGKIVGEGTSPIRIDPSVHEGSTIFSPTPPASQRKAQDLPYPKKENTRGGDVDKKSGGSISFITYSPDFERFTSSDWAAYRAEEKEKECKKLQWCLGVAICIIIAGMFIWEADHPFLAKRIMNGILLLAASALSYSKFPVATCAIVSVISGITWINHAGKLPALIAIVAAVAFVVLLIEKRKVKQSHE